MRRSSAGCPRSWAALSTWLLLSLALSPAKATPPIDKLTYHVDAQRSGWNSQEPVLTPRKVASADFGLLWQTGTLDYYEGMPPRVFATPLYLHNLHVKAGRYKNQHASALFVVTSTGYAYAVSAATTATIPAGEILWRHQLTGRPCEDGTMGNLGTPVIKPEAGQIYITACDSTSGWAVHSLDLGDGQEAAGWPVVIASEAVNGAGINRNGATRFQDLDRHIQRGALNLNASGTHLYVPFGFDDSSGWLVVVDTHLRKVVSAFSTTAATEEIQGGMWSSDGPSIDAQGRVYIATGASSTQMLKHAGIPGVFPDSAHSWGESSLRFSDRGEAGLELLGTYTPFNYCIAAANDIDLGSSGTVVVDLDSRTGSGQHFLVLGGGKQGNAYLLDRDHFPGGTLKRHACSDDSTSDRSLLPPEDQPQFSKRGPLNLFGPYSDTAGSFDQAKSRSTAAYYKSSKNEPFLFVSGTSKRSADSSYNVPPSLLKLEIVRGDEAPYLKVRQLETTQTFQNPGSPMVSSAENKDAVVWVLDANAPRTATIYGPHAANPILYAFDADTLQLLWKSAPGSLSPGGKYNEPTVANGYVYVGTDRVQAFGLSALGTRTDTRSLKKPSSVDWRGDLAGWHVSRAGREMQLTSESEASPLTSSKSYANFEMHFKFRLEGDTAALKVGVRTPSRGDCRGYSTVVSSPNAVDVFSLSRDDVTPAVIARLGDNAEGYLQAREHKIKQIGLVNEPDVIKAAIHPYPSWNDYSLLVSGNQIAQAVNGVLVNTVTDNDPERRCDAGALKLQARLVSPSRIEIAEMEIAPVTWPYLWKSRFSTHPHMVLASLTPDQRKAIEMGKTIYQQRCSVCHGNPNSGAPSVQTLAEFPAARIADVLANGAMREIAAGLSEESRTAVATFITTEWVDSADATH
jgi:3-keto-disaccharide hydrolase/Cytochrome C oxidase, cbb3-type, subunit III